MKNEALFSGIIGKDYDMLKLICPLATQMSHLVGETIAEYAENSSTILNVVELGGGTGITTLALLTATEKINVLSVDNEPVMQQQAKMALANWVENERLTFCSDDALTALKNLPDKSVDAIASAYTFHNFESNYRALVVAEMHRVLKTGGHFVNGDRYALDDISAHTKMTQAEVAGYFKVLIAENRLDLLEHWIIHLFNDESENHVMRETVALNQLKNTGFSNITLTHRMQVNALVTAVC